MLIPPYKVYYYNYHKIIIYKMYKLLFKINTVKIISVLFINILLVYYNHILYYNILYSKNFLLICVLKISNINEINKINKINFNIIYI
jgi:hypothetical protein